MDAFEQLIASIHEANGYWVKTNYKVRLTAADKRRIRRPSCPRWDIDVLAYKARTRELRVIECKSYLNSSGVKLAGLTGKNHKLAKRYKLFIDSVLRRVVLRRLKKQLHEDGSCRSSLNIQLCLAAGRIAGGSSRKEVGLLFEREGWQLFDADWIRGELNKIASSDYINEIAAVTSKLLKQ